MTRRQHTVFEFIRRYWSEHGRGPSWKQINDALGLSGPGSTYQLTKGLVERGCVRKAGTVRNTTWIPYLDGRGL